METSIKTGFAQIFYRCPKNLSCPKFGGDCSPPRPPGPYAYENEESYWKDLETNVSQLRTLLSPNNKKEIHAEVQPMVSEVEAAFWKIARRVEWMKCVRSCSEQLVCDPSTSALYENLVKWRMASCLG